MNTWVLVFKEEDKKNFEQIKNGEKEVETRAGTVKYQKIEIGDELIFTCGNEKFSKKVQNKEHFSSIDEVVKKIPYDKIMPGVESVSEMKKIYSSYDDYDQKIKKFGILAFWLK